MRVDKQNLLNVYRILKPYHKSKESLIAGVTNYYYYKVRSEVSINEWSEIVNNVLRGEEF